jgi:hypothetical protein
VKVYLRKYISLDNKGHQKTIMRLPSTLPDCELTAAYIEIHKRMNVGILTARVTRRVIHPVHEILGLPARIVRVPFCDLVRGHQ